MATEDYIEKKQEIHVPRKIRGIAEEFNLLEEIREIRTLKVSERGRGLCLYLPKDLTEVHGIISGDRLKVQFREHYRFDESADAKSVLHSSSKMCKGKGDE